MRILTVLLVMATLGLLAGCSNSTISKNDPHQKDNLTNKEKSDGEGGTTTIVPPAPPAKSAGN